jgi:processive 1,2-diacylglycerol beta-glucosyltransferase
MSAIRLIDTSDGRELGLIDRDQLDFIVDAFEEESSTDRDYFLDVESIDFLAERGADAALLAVLRRALGEREELEFRWEVA